MNEILTRGGFWNIRSLMKIFPIRKRLVMQAKKFGSMLLQKPKDSQKTDTHNLPQLWHSRVVKSSNMTFGGYLVCITPVLSVRSSLIVLCRYYFEHIRTV